MSHQENQNDQSFPRTSGHLELQDETSIKPFEGVEEQTSDFQSLLHHKYSNDHSSIYISSFMDDLDNDGPPTDAIKSVTENNSSYFEMKSPRKHTLVTEKEFKKMMQLMKSIPKNESGYVTCDQCSYKSKSKHLQSLKEHILTFHLGVRIPCDQCEYLAKRNRDLFEHKNRMHNICHDT